MTDQTQKLSPERAWNEFAMSFAPFIPGKSRPQTGVQNQVVKETRPRKTGKEISIKQLDEHDPHVREQLEELNRFMRVQLGTDNLSTLRNNKRALYTLAKKFPLNLLTLKVTHTKGLSAAAMGELVMVLGQPDFWLK